MDVASVKSEVESINPYFPQPAVKLTPRRQKTHVEAIAKPRRGIVADKPAVERAEGDGKSRVLGPIYERMAMAQRTKTQGPQQCKLRPEQQEGVAHRLYYESVQQKGRMVQEIRAKYRPPIPVPKHLQQDGVDDLVLRLYRSPSAPSILGHLLHGQPGGSPKSPPKPAAALRRFHRGSSSDEEDEAAVHSDAGPVADSTGLSGPIKLNRKRATTVMTTNGTTVLACIKQNRQEAEPTGYSSEADPHLIKYWKVLRRRRRRAHRAAAGAPRRAGKEAQDREKPSRAAPKPPAPNVWHRRELLLKEELHARLIVKMMESDARKDLRDACRGHRPWATEGHAGGLKASTVPSARHPSPGPQRGAEPVAKKETGTGDSESDMDAASRPGSAPASDCADASDPETSDKDSNDTDDDDDDDDASDSAGSGSGSESSSTSDGSTDTGSS